VLGRPSGLAGILVSLMRWGPAMAGNGNRCCMTLDYCGGFWWHDDACVSAARSLTFCVGGVRSGKGKFAVTVGKFALSDVLNSTVPR
jgi:hypothetical protein